MNHRIRTALHGGCLCLLAAGVHGAHAAGDTHTTVIDNPGRGTNRIEVTGNRARNITVQCGDAPGAAPQRERSSVNSVNVDKRALQGRTVIVTGRNSENADLRVDCAQGEAPAANINSVNIR